MEFTLGNIITLGITALALMLYRLADKNNRPLEKVKKYAEKCKEEIAAYADEKSMAVKNFGIDLDVEKKAAVQLMKSIQKLTEEELAKKSESIAQIEGHIKKFESSLDDLFGMTDRVQENLNRIRDESVFVENTGRKVTEAKEKFEHVEKLLAAAEKNLEDTEARLEIKNAEILEKTALEVVGSAKSIVSDFEATAQVIERKVEEHRDALIKSEKEREAVLAHDLELIKKTLRDVLESAGKRADKMEETALVKLREQAQERVGQIKVFFEDKIKITQDTLKTEQTSINEKLKNIHDKWNEVSTSITRERDTISSALVQQQNDWKESFQEFKKLTDKQRKELDFSISTAKQELNQSIVELKTKSATTIKQQQVESNELIAKINASISELQSLAKNIHKQQQEELHFALNEMKRKTENSLKQQQSELTSAITSHEAELESTLKDLREKSTAALSKQQKEVAFALNDFNEKSAVTISVQQGELASVLKDLKDKSTAAISGQQNELTSTLKDLKDRSVSAISGQQNELVSTLKDLKDKSTAAISGQQSDLASTLKEFRNNTVTTVSEQENLLNSIINELRNNTVTAVSEQENLLNSAIKELREKSTTAVSKQENELDSTLKELREKTITTVTSQQKELSSVVGNHQKELAATLKELKDKTDYAITNQQADLSTELKKQMEDWKHLCKGTEQDIIAANEKRLEEYSKMQAEAVRHLNSLADDASNLKNELTLSMQDSISKVRKEYAEFEKEAAANMDKTAVSFNAQAQGFKTRLEEMDKELNTIKQQALDNTSKKLTLFEKDFAADLTKRTAEIGKQITAWQDGLEKRIEISADKISKDWQKSEEKAMSDQRKSIAILGEKLISELARLKEETNAFEKGIREEMHNMDGTRSAFAEQINKDIAEIRITAENEVKHQVGQYQLSLQETLRQKQREMEKEIEDITERSKTAYEALDDAAVKTRENFDEWQSSYNNKMREMDNSLETIRRQSRETAGENDERIAQFRQHLDDIRKEMSAQKKLFDQTNDVKQELERSIDEMNGHLNRIEQRKSEITQLESQFTHIKRQEDEINRKMQSFLSERHRIDIMQKDFDRLIKISQVVEQKLTQVSTSDDILSNVQVQIRKLEDSLKSTDEKYQRIERKNEVLEQTNDGIDRNFKTLQQTEAAIKNAEKGISGISEQFNGTKSSIEALAAESIKAKEASEKITVLDEALVKIEKRIQEMNVAREWLARTETELKNLDKDLQSQVKIAKTLSKKDGSKFPAADKDKGAPPPQDRDNVLRLKEKGWTVDEIANAMNLGKGEVELILEIGSRG
ncbi:MAG: hypothetical protein LBU88_01850 [Treponema sp.]|jgi:chromosome segregation ATPase|nr:hypothetical protein [Treponema sp.]